MSATELGNIFYRTDSVDPISVCKLQSRLCSAYTWNRCPSKEAASTIEYNESFAEGHGGAGRACGAIKSNQEEKEQVCQETVRNSYQNVSLISLTQWTKEVWTSLSLKRKWSRILLSGPCHKLGGEHNKVSCRQILYTRRRCKSSKVNGCRWMKK